MNVHARPPRGGSPRGIVLLAVCVVVFLVLAAVIAMGMTSSENLASVALSVYEKQAIYAAEAGIRDSLLQLRASSTWGAGGPGVIPTGFSNKAVPGQSEVSYTVAVTNNHTGSGPLTADDGTSIPAGCVYLRSTGTATQSVRRTVSALARQ